MSANSSPGWYPDPGHAGNGPAPERWWDGAAWTGRTRAPAEPEPPAPDPADAGRRPEPRRAPAGTREPGRRPVVFMAVGSALMLAALVTGGVLVLGDRGEGGSAGPDPTAPATGTDPEGETDDRGEPDDSATPSPLPLSGPGPGGLALPVLPGWEEKPGGGGLLVTTGDYPCPADPARSCVTAGAFLGTADPAAGTDPRLVAEADITAHIEESFGDATYAGVTGRERVLAARTAVAGENGYRIRELLTTGAGISAYAETVVFPAPDGSGELLVLRLGFDVGADAPPADDMDRIAAGVRRPAGDGSPA